MFIQSKIAAAALGLSLMTSVSTQATQVSVESYVTHVVNQAMKVAQQELQNSLLESVGNATQKVSFNGEAAVKTKVTITDIKEPQTKSSKVATQ